jgi:hypothetical protein
MSIDSIARLKITLDDVEPQVLRRIEVPLNIRLDRLHLVLQAAMGWTNSHLWEIRVREVGFGPPGMREFAGFQGGPLNAAKATLIDVLENIGAKTLKYLYDFGDGWEHTIKLERILDPAPGVSYPLLIAASGACPPEDIGGVPGYEEFLAAIADPEHERHDEIVEWHGDDFDPSAVDADRINAAFADLAKRWTRKPAVRKSKAA